MITTMVLTLVRLATNASLIQLLLASTKVKDVITGKKPQTGYNRVQLAPLCQDHLSRVCASCRGSEAWKRGCVRGTDDLGQAPTQHNQQIVAN